MTHVWVSVAYMGVDFSINNILMAAERLEPGGEVWCAHKSNRTIPIKLHETYHSWGITSATSYLKILVGTKEINTDHFNQPGLELEANVPPLRQLALDTEPPREDWLAKTIPLNIHYPLEVKSLHADIPVRWFGHLMSAPPGFSANVCFKTLSAACDNFAGFPDLEFLSGVWLQPLELGPAETRPQLSVLELSRIHGVVNLSPQTPLRIQLREDTSRLPNIRVYQQHPDTLTFHPLTSQRQGQNLLIHKLITDEQHAPEQLLFFFHHQ